MYVPVIHSANYGLQYFIQVVVNIIGYFTYCYYRITNNKNQKSEQHKFCKCVKSAIRRRKALRCFPSKQY